MKPVVIQWKQIVPSVLLDARPPPWLPKLLITVSLARPANTWMLRPHLRLFVKVVQKVLLNRTKHRLTVWFVPLQSIHQDLVRHCV
jgi:hypothetical protein